MTGVFEPKTFESLKGLQLRALSDPRITERIRVLDKYCLPVRYTDSYYDKYVRIGLHQYNQLAYFNDILIGSLTCRLETNDDGEQRLYIMTIVVLEPYRKLGIGSRLLQRILDNVHADSVNHIVAVVLHMQVGSPVQEFYKRFNFETVETVKDYYTDLEERDALLLRLVVPQPHLKKSNK